MMDQKSKKNTPATLPTNKVKASKQANKQKWHNKHVLLHILASRCPKKNILNQNKSLVNLFKIISPYGLLFYLFIFLVRGMWNSWVCSTQPSVSVLPLQTREFKHIYFLDIDILFNYLGLLIFQY